MPDAEELTQKDFAKRLGISPRAVRKLHAHEIPRLESGRYPWPEARNWYIEFKQNEKARRYGGNGKLNIDEERAKRMAVQRQIAELNLAEREGDLVPLDQHERRCADFAESINDALRGIPGRWAPKLAKIETVPEMQAALKSLVNELLRRLAEDDDSFADAD